MIQFNVQNISKYRGQLMGIATLLVIFGHSVGNGVAMPRWMESLCGLSSVGVDIFLLVSGLGLWYSLTSLNGNNFERVNIWYLRRYKRILIPYLIIIGFQKVLSVLHGMPLLQALFELSTLSYWVNHQGAWFIAMLIPVYALTPLHYRICNKVKSPVVYSLLLIVFVVVISALNYPVESIACQMLIDNVKQVLYHLPSFLIGFMLAPFAKTGKKISYFWMSILPLVFVAIMKVMQCGYWPEFLVLPFVVVCCSIFKYMGKIISSVLNFFGKISLESYLLNGVVGTWIIWYLPTLYNSPINKVGYLSYFIVCVVGTVLAHLIHLMCDKLFFKSKER